MTLAIKFARSIANCNDRDSKRAEAAAQIDTTSAPGSGRQNLSRGLLKTNVRDTFALLLEEYPHKFSSFGSRSLAQFHVLLKHSTP